MSTITNTGTENFIRTNHGVRVLRERSFDGRFHIRPRLRKLVYFVNLVTRAITRPQSVSYGRDRR